MKRFVWVVVLLIFLVVGCDDGERKPDPSPIEGDGVEAVIFHQPDIIQLDDAPDAVWVERDLAEIRGKGGLANTKIVLTVDGATIEGLGASVATGTVYDVFDEDGEPTGETLVYGTVVEITESGVYLLEGALNGGFVAISKKNLAVTLILNGVNIYCPNYAGIVCLKKSVVNIVLAEDSQNFVTDGGQDATDGKYYYAFDDEEQPNAAVLIRSDLTIDGSGALTVVGGLNNGIGSRGHLIFLSGDITAYGKNNALKGNDSLTIFDGRYTLVSEGDGIKTESVDAELGSIIIYDGHFRLKTHSDGLDAATDIVIFEGVMSVDASGHGFSAGDDVVITEGNISIQADKSAISGRVVTIFNVNLLIWAEENGIEASEILIMGGGISVANSTNGMVAENVTFTEGYTIIRANQIGIVASTEQGDAQASILGGKLCVDASHQGIYADGNVSIVGGATVIYAQPGNDYLAIDCTEMLTLSGGTLVTVGSRPIQPSNLSSCQGLAFDFEALDATVLVSLALGDREIATVKTLHGGVTSIFIASPLIGKGTFDLYAGGSHTGNCHVGMYFDGVYTKGTLIDSIDHVIVAI